MFRPYSLKSIAAWTAGAYAGNIAYYQTKAGGLNFKMSKVACPQDVRKLRRKLESIEKEFSALLRSGSHMKPSEKGVNLTPVIRLIVYNEWIQSNLTAIKSEIKETFKASTSIGYIWPSSVISECQTHLESVAENSKRVTLELQKLLNSVFDQVSDAGLRQKIQDAIENQKTFCMVDNATCKLIILNPQRLFI